MSVETARPSRLTRLRKYLRRSHPKIRPLPGRLYAERKRCGRRNCHCAMGGDALHGPYLYRRWLDRGRYRRQYVKPADADRVRAGLAEWKRLHPPARSTRDLLAELRRLSRELKHWGPDDG